MVQRPRLKTLVSLMCGAIILGSLTLITAGCQSSPGISIPGASTDPAGRSVITPSPSTTQQESANLEPTDDQVLSTPTLAPTATPSQLDVVVEDISQRVGIDQYSIFTLSGEELVNIIVSFLIVLTGSLFGVLFVNGLLWVADRTPAEFDYQMLASIENQLKWLITLILIDIATARLDFINPRLKQWLDLIYFSLFILVIASIIWKLIDYGLKRLPDQTSSLQNRNLLITFSPLIGRSLEVLIFLIALAIILQQFGVNLTALFAVLGLGGLAVSLAAKETFEDIINGFIILIDRPFQVGDRIKIETMNSWGDVVVIGSRTTQILTLDNRLVVVPNSVIGNSQLENYTRPDPKYRAELTLGIGYDSDIDQVIEIIERAVLSVAGISKQPPPFVRLEEFGDSAMIFRAFYWLKSYKDLELRTTVNKSIYQSLSKANIEMPFTTYDLNLNYQEPARKDDSNQSS